MLEERHNSQKNKGINDEMSLKDFIIKIINFYLFLKSKVKFILLFIIIGGITSLLLLWNEKPTYKATLTFAMEDDKGGAGGLSGALGLASSFGIDLAAGGGGAFAATNLSELMKSRLIVEKVLLEPVIIKEKETTLAEYYIEVTNLRKNWSQKSTLKNLHFLPNSDRTKFGLQKDSILQNIYKSLIDKEHLIIMQKDKKVTILSIDVISIDELFSLIFCTNLAKETSNFYIETKSKKAKINVDVLQNQVDSIKIALNGAITGVATEVDNVYNLNPAFNIKSTTSKKRQIDVQSNTAILTNLVVQLELAKITLRKETPLIQIIDKPILPLEIEKNGKVKMFIFGCLIGLILSIFYFGISLFYKNVINS
jgi:hypothetical protein